MRRRAVITLTVLGVIVVGGVALADTAARNYAQDRIAAEVKSGLPSEATGDVTANVGGLFFLGQYLTGKLETVTIESSDLQVAGVPVATKIVATGVPTDLTLPVENVEATLTLSEAAVNAAAKIPGAGSLVLNDGTVGYTGALTAFGLSMNYTVMAQAAPQPGNIIVLTPQEVTLASGGGALDISGLLGGVKNTAVPICLASFLPKDLAITGITVSQGSADVVISGKNIVLNEATLSTLGSCG